MSSVEQELQQSSEAGPSSTVHSPKRSKKSAPRSRKGCLVCRARRIRCDEEHPECARCVKYGAECVYPAKRPFDKEKIDERLKKRHGGATAHRSTPPDPSPSTVQKLFDDAPTSVDALLAMCRATRMGSFFANTSGPPPDYLKAAYADEDEVMCLHHCLSYSLSILVIREDNNPWIRHVMPMFLAPNGTAPTSTEALRYAMLAIGATHLSYLHSRVRTEIEDLHHRVLSQTYRAKSIRLLRSAKSSTETASDAYLAAALALCVNDIFAAETTWREAWAFAVRGIQHRGGCEQILFGRGDTSELQRLLVETACLTDLSVTLSSGEPPRILTAESGWWERLGKTGPESESFEMTKGIQRRIFRLAIETARLVAERISLDRLDSEPFLRKKHEADLLQLEADLDLWQEEYPTFQMDGRTQTGSLAYWNASNILVQRELRGVSDDRVCGSVTAILDLCVETGDKIEYMNWPLVIASVRLEDNALRDKSRAIMAMFAYQCCEEIKRIAEIVEELWRRIDEGREVGFCGWILAMVEMGRPVLLG